MKQNEQGVAAKFVLGKSGSRWQTGDKTCYSRNTEFLLLVSQTIFTVPGKWVDLPYNVLPSLTEYSRECVCNTHNKCNTYCKEWELVIK